MQKLKKIFLIICFLPLFLGARNTKYIKKHKPISKELGKKYKIPYKFILAVAVMETEGGRSKICKKLHNHFGVKGKNKANWKTKYKQYPNDKASYEDFCRIVRNKRFYPTLKGNDTISLWVAKLAKTGYSSNPTQWQKNIHIILKTL
jgi:flagellum-specific peptidoglycan hydrolase FlgJ